MQTDELNYGGKQLATRSRRERRNVNLFAGSRHVQLLFNYVIFYSASKSMITEKITVVHNSAKSNDRVIVKG